jgi:hypothetical protein
MGSQVFGPIALAVPKEKKIPFKMCEADPNLVADQGLVFEQG